MVKVSTLLSASLPQSVDKNLTCPVEFVLGIIKIIAVIGFIFLGVIINCGGVPTDNRGYIGAEYWHKANDPDSTREAFKNGFKGFCSVFVTAAFAFAGTELVGLAAAEAEDPRKTLPKATKQVFWRIAVFYILSLFILGLILPSDDERLLGASGANTKASPFVLAIKAAGIAGLPSVFNAVITLSVISVANSATFASTRTLQALAMNRMAPSIFKYVDPQGRPLWCIILQLVFGLLAFINEADVGTKVFTWLLSLSALNNLFVWASICLSHIRFRRGWAAQGHTLDELPFKAEFGVIGSYIGFSLNVIALLATFYVSLFVSSSPPGEPIPMDLSRLTASLSHTAHRQRPRSRNLLPNLPVGAHCHRPLRILEGQDSRRAGLVRAIAPNGPPDRAARIQPRDPGCGEETEMGASRYAGAVVPCDLHLNCFRAGGHIDARASCMNVETIVER